MKLAGLLLAGIAIIANPFARLLNPPGLYIANAILVVAGILGLIIEYIKTRTSDREKKQLEKDVVKSGLYDILGVALLSVRAYQERKNTKTLRINLMVVDQTKRDLSIIAQIGMSSDPDKDITFGLGQGCCGTCAELGEVVIGDLENIYGNSYQETCQKNEGRSPWGISKLHWESTRDLKSLISVPVFDPDDLNSVIAVLNLDDKISIDEAKFTDEVVTEMLESVTYLLAKRLVKLH
ncbi:hypothetical protein SY88_10175 [Clostridiales bacterium PH28_bin88]|nr:hypothetical protein SY88_10175 [Clostridiales bacterium PH28_bin88]